MVLKLNSIVNLIATIAALFVAHFGKIFKRSAQVQKFETLNLDVRCLFPANSGSFSFSRFSVLELEIPMFGQILIFFHLQC